MVTPVETADINADGDIISEIINSNQDLIAYFDPEYDYYANKRYQVAYIAIGPASYSINNPYFTQIHDQIEHWANRMNVEYNRNVNFCDNIGDFSEILSELVGNDVDGILIDYLFSDDIDNNRIHSMEQILNESGIPWMYGMLSSYSSSQILTESYPVIDLDEYTRGALVAETLLDIKDALYPDIPYENIGFITLGHTMVTGIVKRVSGAENAWKTRTGCEDNLIRLDDSLTWLDSEYPPLKEALEEHPQYEYIFVGIMIADQDAIGIEDYFSSRYYEGPDVNLHIVTTDITFSPDKHNYPHRYVGDRWASGVTEVIDAAICLPGILHAEVVMGALYAFMSGQATPETIWPSWKSTNSEYPVFNLPYYTVTPSNFRDFYAWLDVYAGTNEFPDYYSDGITRDSFSR